MQVFFLALLCFDLLSLQCLFDQNKTVSAGRQEAVIPNDIIKFTNSSAASINRS